VRRGIERPKEGVKKKEVTSRRDKEELIEGGGRYEPYQKWPDCIPGDGGTSGPNSRLALGSPG
jgi:hypothetical protein